MKKVLWAGLIGGWLVWSSGVWANVAVLVDNPNRNVSELWTDAKMTREITDELNNFAYLDDYRHRVGVSVFRKNVLLTGEVSNQQINEYITQMIQGVAGVDRIYNAMMISGLTRGQSHSAHEAYLRTKLETNLLKNNQFSLLAYELTVRNDTAYFLGQFSDEEAEALKKIALGTGGILAAEIVNVAKQMPSNARFVPQSQTSAVVGTQSVVNNTTYPANALAPTKTQVTTSVYQDPYAYQDIYANQYTNAYISPDVYTNQNFYTNPDPYGTNYPSALNQPQSDYVRLYQNQQFAP